MIEVSGGRVQICHDILVNVSKVENMFATSRELNTSQR